MLKNIINKIEEIVIASSIYNDFREGHISEIAGSIEYKYPMIWVDDEENPHSFTTSTTEYVFDIYFMDLVFNDRSNELNIKSDSIESAKDFVRLFKDSYNELDFYIKDDESYSIQNFSFKFDDAVAGAKLSVTFTEAGAGNICKNIFSV